jgi:hypothetical protein
MSFGLLIGEGLRPSPAVPRSASPLEDRRETIRGEEGNDASSSLPSRSRIRPRQLPPAPPPKLRRALPSLAADEEED